MRNPASVTSLFSKAYLCVKNFNPVYFCTGVSAQKTMSDLQWKTEKERYQQLPLEEKRKLYKSKDYVTVAAVQTWCDYARGNDLSDRQANKDDLAQLSKVTINGVLNERLAGKVSIFKGDITKLEVDAIVNAANSRLIVGGGVDGAIHRAAGPLLEQECRHIGGCKTGDAVVTGGYLLPAKYVIQTVGPTDKSAAMLNSCYSKCFSLLPEHKISTVAFPCISTGIYGFPNRLAAHIALANARKALEEDASGKGQIERVIFCTFLPVDVEIYETLMKLYFPV